MIVLCALIPVLLLVTAILSIGARRSLLRDMERILREMDFSEVEQRVQWTARHAQIFAANIAALMLTYMLDLTSPEFRMMWIAGVYIHALSLYLYYVRWNPETLERKRQIDAEHTASSSTVFDESATYAISEEGELIKIQAADAESSDDTNTAPRHIDSL